MKMKFNLRSMTTQTADLNLMAGHLVLRAQAMSRLVQMTLMMMEIRNKQK